MVLSITQSQGLLVLSDMEELSFLPHASSSPPVFPLFFMLFASCLAASLRHTVMIKQDFTSSPRLTGM